MPSTRQYESHRIYKAFKRTRTKLRQYCPEQLISGCIERLRRCEDPETSLELYTQAPPWFLLLLIKWTLMFGELRYSFIYNPLKIVPGALPGVLIRFTVNGFALSTTAFATDSIEGSMHCDTVKPTAERFACATVLG